MKTFLTETWNLGVPIIGAPMSPQAGGVLAAAITNAGGLGLIGTAASQTTASIASDVEEFQKLAGDKKFGIGLMAWVLVKRPELLDAAIALKPFVISLSFGDVAPYAARVRDAGIKLACQVQDQASALAAEAAGADLIVAQGTEAGGHTGGVGTLPLLQIVLESVRTPVVAAGGIATGRGLAAVIAAGAEGAWIGTPFLVAEEARNSNRARELFVAAKETETVLTSTFDVAQSIPWPAQYRARGLRNAFSDRFHEHCDSIDEAARTEFSEAKRAEDYRVANLYAGQSVALAKRVEPAAQIMKRIADDADHRLGQITARR